MEKEAYEEAQKKEKEDEVQVQVMASAMKLGKKIFCDSNCAWKEIFFQLTNCELTLIVNISEKGLRKGSE